LYLNKLEIIGFKSFADKVTVDFDSGITAIVGPNGCGKTNIVDAVRWAIGEQKASVLRSSTMENVIFNGTKERKALGYAQVSLTIENTKGILPSEYSEITITRRCFRDGQSNYLLNGVQCRLKDITSLFMDTGMGSDAYSVIELKMVNEILSHRTQDRRKLFEEASGITKYKERRREALYKLELAKENLTEANIEIRNRQRTVNAYERIAQKQQEAMQISERLKVVEIDYHQRYLSKLIDETKQVEEELKIMEEQRESIQVELNKNESIIDNYKRELDVTERNLNELREKLLRINLNISEVQNEISISEQRISYLQENIDRFSKEKIYIEKQIDKHTDAKIELESKIEVLKSTIQLLDESRNNKKLALDEIEVKVKLSKDELKDLTAKHAAVSRKVIEKRSEYELVKSKLENQLARCSKLTEENITGINKVTQHDKELQILEEQLQQNKNVLEKQNVEYNDRKRDKVSLEEDILQLEKDIVSKSYEIDKLKEKINFQINLLETYEDYSEGIRYLVKERKEGNVDVVIDKLEVEDKFKVAIETALGEISNYLIVNDEASAHRFIDILKEKQKGKITFILRNNLYNTGLNIFQEEFPEILKQEGVYGWADMFIKCPDEYWMLYKYFLDEYIIVENLDVAKKLSKDNFIKFITLDGDIVTNSFLRAGSSTNLETLKIGREKLIKGLQENIVNFEKEIELNKKELESVKAKYDSIELEPIEKEIKSLKDSIVNLESKITQINYVKQQTNSVLEKNNRESEQFGESNKELSSQIDILINEIEEAENVKYQREKELDHFTTELESLADELTTKREEYNNFNIEATKVRGELINLENELKRTNDSISGRKNTIEFRTRECEEYEREIGILKSKLEGVDEAGNNTGLKYNIAAFDKQKAEIEIDYNLIKNEYDAKRSLLETIDQEQRAFRSKRDAIIDFIHKNEMRLTKDRIEIKEHQEKIKEEYSEDIVYTAYEDNDMFDFVKTKSDIDKMRFKLKQLGGTGQMELGIYEQEKRELESLIEDKNDLIKAQDDLANLIEQINKQAQEKFAETFEQIRTNFQAIFRELFMEGDEADLKLVIDPDNPDPLDAKIDIIAKPRGKRPQLIDLLSGGEKTLTAIALLFAIYQVKPSPFCILDEVDAPLDDANIDRFIKIIRKFSKETQFIIVTHNKRTMEAADTMYGVTMAQEGISTIVNVKFNDQAAAVNN
jgi:chromosome segregation protein